MVRVISEKLFSPPRSRHSSGETVDKELAARAVEALPSFANSKRFELSSDYESSSDSHWDSEVDFEEDGPLTPSSEAGALGDDGHRSTDVVRKRKERRRERNKLSAQAYRMRRRELSVKQQSVLATLQEENTRLKSQVQVLEDKISKFRNAVMHSRPDTVPNPLHASPSSVLSDVTLPSTPSQQPGRSRSSRSQSAQGCSSEMASINNFSDETSENGNHSQGSVGGLGSSQPSVCGISSCRAAVGGFGFCSQSEEPVSFDQLAQRDPSRQPPLHHPHQLVDNAQSRRQQISPLVDNFSFASSLRRPSPAASPCSSVGSVLSNPATPTPTAPPSPGPLFTFPAAAPATTGGPSCQKGQLLLGQMGSLNTALGEQAGHHPLQYHYQQQRPQYQHHHHHTQQADLNANGNECRNDNMNNALSNNNHHHESQQLQHHYSIHASSTVHSSDNGNQPSSLFNLCQNDNAAGLDMNAHVMNNNNNMTFLAVPGHFATASAATAASATGVGGVGAAQLQLLAPQPVVFKVTKA